MLINLIVAAALVTNAGPEAVEGTPNVQTVSVSLSDLSVSRGLDRDRLNERIQIAAKQACREAFTSDQLAPYHVRSCRRKVEALAMAEVDRVAASVVRGLPQPNQVSIQVAAR